MARKFNYSGKAKYVKIAFIAERGVFPICCCPEKLFTKIVITRSFSTSTGFMMAHFEAKIQEKTLLSHKSHVVKGQMFLGYFAQFWTHNVIHGLKA